MAQIIGQAIDRIDGPAKVTGAAPYAGDSRGRPHGLRLHRHRHDRLRPHHRHRHRRCARRMPGVLLVMTHENAPHQAPFQAKGEDRHARPKPQLTSDKVQYFGEPVALVVAETAEGARAAADSGDRRLRTQPPAPSRSNSASRDAYDPKKTNNGTPSDSTVGAFDSAFEVAPVRVDAIYKTPYQSHAMMEPHAQPRLVAGRQAHDPQRRCSWSKARTSRSPARCSCRPTRSR